MFAQNDWNIAKHLRNTTNSNIRRAKANFVVQKLNQFRGDSKKFWNQIRSIYPTTKDMSSPILTLEDGGNIVAEHKTADFINDFFINIGNAKSMRNSRPTPASQVFVQPGLDILDPFTEGEVFKIVNSICTTKSSGLENVSSGVIKAAFSALISPLTHLYNLSLSTCLFPDKWKEARVVPIPKGGDTSQVTNLRPISLLPIPGKILEKLIHTKISEYLENNNLLSPYQHGFRKDHSTMAAIHQLVDTIGHNMDNRIPTLVTFIDFRKAFDCVQHDILLTKLSKFGLDQMTLQWVASYLKQRKQKVLANNMCSEQAIIKQGVPQGSILGPLLYLLYANDLASVIKNCGFSFYADDTVLYSHNANFNIAKRNMNRNLRALNDWFTQNCIAMNVTKTKYMLFGSRMSLAKIKPFALKIDNQAIERVYKYTYLGVILDPILNYDKQISATVARVSGKVKQLRRVREFLNTQAALLVYKNMILPILEYADIFVTAASKENRDKLQVLQNRALRTVFQVDRYHSTELLHDEAKLLRLRYRRETHILQFMYTKSKDTNFCKKSTRRRSRIGVKTRSQKKCNFILGKPSTEKYKRSISYKGPKIWNTLPGTIQKANSGFEFKNKVCKFMNKKTKKALAA